MIKIKIHSIVDVITNSSTVIYTFQNSIKQAKLLVQAVLDLCGENKLTPDDVFCYGVFCDMEYAFEGFCGSDLPSGCPENWKEHADWIDGQILEVLSGNIEKPSWMTDAERDDEGYDPDLILYLLPKDDKYEALAATIKGLLNSVTADGGMDG